MSHTKVKSKEIKGWLPTNKFANWIRKIFGRTEVIDFGKNYEKIREELKGVYFKN